MSLEFYPLILRWDMGMQQVNALTYYRELEYDRPWKQCILGNVVFLHRLSDTPQQTAYLLGNKQV